MAYDLLLADRVRTALVGQPIKEQQMFGGIGFLLNGNMVCGILKNDLMLHVAAEDTAKLLTKPGAKPFVMRERPMNGWVLVEPDAIKTASALKKWVNVSLDYALTLPAKAPKPKAKKLKPPNSQ
jgi:TfoX/Sxy family transcriptional regulator of competence genes